jgi:Zinc knuckle
VAKYYKRFKISAEVLGGHWGDFHPTNLNKYGVTKEEAQDRFLARVFLMGANKRRFGSLIEEYNNSYVAGTDKYPKLLEATLKLLSNYQDSNSGLGKGLDGKETGLGASFAQKGKRDLSKVQCHSCKEYGHYASNCPNKKKSLAQSDSDNTTEEGQETTQTETPVRQCRSSLRTRVVGWSG